MIEDPFILDNMLSVHNNEKIIELFIQKAQDSGADLHSIIRRIFQGACIKGYTNDIRFFIQKAMDLGIDPNIMILPGIEFACNGIQCVVSNDLAVVQLLVNKGREIGVDFLQEIITMKRLYPRLL